jgi:hypothetical protein
MVSVVMANGEEITHRCLIDASSAAGAMLRRNRDDERG